MARGYFCLSEVASVQDGHDKESTARGTASTQKGLSRPGPHQQGFSIQAEGTREGNTETDHRLNRSFWRWKALVPFGQSGQNEAAMTKVSPTQLSNGPGSEENQAHLIPSSGISFSRTVYRYRLQNGPRRHNKCSGRQGHKVPVCRRSDHPENG